MNDNLLLMYLSELGHGNWSRFRQGLEYLVDEEEDLLAGLDLDLKDEKD